MSVCLCVQVLGGNDADTIRRETTEIAFGLVGLAAGSFIVYFLAVRTACTHTHAHLDIHSHVLMYCLISSTLPPPPPDLLAVGGWRAAY